MKNTKFQTPKGTRDFVGEIFYIRQEIALKILKVMERYGFRQVMTPSFESLELLTKDAGEEVASQIYKIIDKNKRVFGLKSDITPALARLVTNYGKTMPRPIKFCCFDRVYRYERPQKDRYREIYQINAEMFGIKSATADAELIKCLYDCYKEIGLSEIIVKIGYRPLLDLFAKDTVGLKYAGKTIQIIDKKNKLTQIEFSNELLNIGLKPTQIGKINQFIHLEGNSSEVFKRLEKLFPKNIQVKKYLCNLKDVLAILEDYQMKDKYVLDLSLARGSEYYTGVIFEVQFPKLGNISIGGGGRYDNLIEFYGGDSTPATGFSIGIDRVYNLLEKLNRLPISSKQIDYYIASETNEECLKTARKLGSKLRALGKNVELPLTNIYLSEQLALAKKLNTKKIIIIKKVNLIENLVRLINLPSGLEKNINLENVLQDTEKQFN